MRLSLEDLDKCSRTELIAIIVEQSRLIDEQGKRIEKLERAAARPAAPFSKGKSKANPKRPGRRKGEGRFERRLEPVAEPTDNVETTRVPLDSDECPACGEKLETDVEVATTIDVPEKAQRTIKRFEVETGKCPRCGMRVRGRHAGLAGDQFGATAHRVGTNVLAQALSLHYHSGLPLRKVPEVMEMITGIDVTQSALTQRAKKLCQEHGALGKVYRELRGEVRRSPVINTDDTGWRTGGQPSYLMGFFSPLLAVFQVRDRHRHEEVEEMIGKDYDGILGTDRGTSYEAQSLGETQQQKCLSHLLKNLSEVEETKRGRARCFTRDIKKTLRAGLELWQEHRAGRIGRAEYRRRGEEIYEELTHQLRDRQMSDADNQRMLDGIGMQHDRGRVFLFLEHPEVEPTNNRAERGLRPAVIARKVSQCSKNAVGAGIFETMKSITATLAIRGQNVAKALANLINGGSIPSAR